MVSALLLAAALTPAPVVVQDPRITESSGLVASPTRPDLVWTVNDSGSSAVVYGVSLRTGRTVATLRLAKTDARDMEAMTATRGADGAGLLWIGDVGDNRAVRASVVLRLVREPVPTASATVRPVSLRVRYPDGPHDVETLIWTPDRRLLLVTKNLFSGVVYEVPAPAVAAAIAGRSTLDPVSAQPVAEVAMSLVTDGAALPDGRIILRGYSGATIYRSPPRAGGEGQALQPLQQVALPAQPQGETLTVVDGGRAVLVGSEGKRQPLQRVELPPAVTAPTTTTGPATTGPATTGPATTGPSPATTGPSAAPRAMNPAPGPRRPLLALATIAVALVAG
ncbi:MAG: hypothetical protein H7231_10470, partial [Rhodoferax sp.]|nr:hypothetical protein [Actinomycetota bacterium]